MREPMVSIIIPAYNEEEYIGDLLDDLIDLNYEDLEIIVVDDGSTDRTREILEDYDVKKVFKEENEGLPSALNKGIEAAEGEFNWQINADLRVRDKKIIKKLLREFDEEIVAVWGAIAVENDDEFFPSMMAASKKLDPDYLYGSANVMFRTEFSKNNPYYEGERITSPDFEMRNKIDNSKQKFAENAVVSAYYPESFRDNVSQRIRYAKSHISRFKREGFNFKNSFPIARDWGAITVPLLLGFAISPIFFYAFWSLVFLFFLYRAFKARNCYPNGLFAFASTFAEVFFVFLRAPSYIRGLIG